MIPLDCFASDAEFEGSHVGRCESIKNKNCLLLSGFIFKQGVDPGTSFEEGRTRKNIFSNFLRRSLIILFDSSLNDQVSEKITISEQVITI